jgi:hypothetical protein
MRAEREGIFLENLLSGTDVKGIYALSDDVSMHNRLLFM